jgi:flagellar basal-body rod protein FlgG
MIDSLNIAATGMQVHQSTLETVAGNITNANTPGYKRARVNFTDLLVKETARANDAAAADGAMPAMASRGSSGVSATGVSRAFDQGELRKTGAAFDLAITGEGFIEVSMPDGSRAWTRGGTLQVNRDGLLATQTGLPLKAAIAVPDLIKDLTIQSDGRVFAKTSDKAAAIELGRIDLVRFQSAGGLQPIGDGLYRALESAGVPIDGKAGDDGFGTLAQGTIEGSNVRMVDEMVTLMVAQRAYEASAKVVQTSDEMLGLINNLRR